MATDSAAIQEMQRQLKALVPDQSIGTPGGDLEEAIFAAMSEAEARGLKRQGTIILAAIRGDIWADPDLTLQWDNRDQYKAHLDGE